VGLSHHSILNLTVKTASTSFHFYEVTDRNQLVFYGSHTHSVCMPVVRTCVVVHDVHFSYRMHMLPIHSVHYEMVDVCRACVHVHL